MVVLLLLICHEAGQQEADIYGHHHLHVMQSIPLRPQKMIRENLDLDSL
jgi:hypothetical protein